jgi:hypothetical protein
MNPFLQALRSISGVPGDVFLSRGPLAGSGGELGGLGSGRVEKMAGGSAGRPGANQPREGVNMEERAKGALPTRQDEAE